MSPKNQGDINWLLGLVGGVLGLMEFTRLESDVLSVSEVINPGAFSLAPDVNNPNKQLISPWFFGDNLKFYKIFVFILIFLAVFKSGMSREVDIWHVCYHCDCKSSTPP